MSKVVGVVLVELETTPLPVRTVVLTTCDAYVGLAPSVGGQLVGPSVDVRATVVA